MKILALYPNYPGLDYYFEKFGIQVLPVLYSDYKKTWNDNNLTRMEISWWSERISSLTRNIDWWLFHLISKQFNS